MSGRIAGHRRLLQRLQSAYELHCTAAAVPGVTCSGEALSRSKAVASTSGCDTRSSHQGCSWSSRSAPSRLFTSSASVRADADRPISRTLQAKKQYRQQQKGRPPPPPPPRPASPAMVPSAPAENTRLAWDEPQEEEGELMTTERSITELEESDLLQYFSVDPQALPEAFPEHSSLAALDMLPKSGCKGLQEEIEATGQKYVMYRPIIRSLIEAVEQQEVRQLLLDGMPGAGKSVALSLLAQWARRKGWVVLYVANAEVLTDGGFYSQNEAADGWDTPQSAHYILHNLLASHRDALEKLRTKDGTRSLAEVASEGLESSVHAVSVDAALAVIEALEAQSEVPVMIAVDRYNALYTDSQYGQTMSVHKRRLVPASELRLARALRVLERPAPALGLHVAAPARHDRISQRIAMTLNSDCTVVEVPRFAPVEWGNALDWYDATALLDQSDMDALLTYMMCQGNARELRQTADGLTFQHSTVQYHDRR